MKIRDEYYTDRVCYDFLITPTLHSQKVMKYCGLRLTPRPGGFIVVYDRKRVDALMNYIKREKGNMPRLSFEMAQNNPLFINFTDLPSGANKLYESLYFSNANAHKSKGNVLINTGKYVSGKELLESKSGLLRVDNPDTSKKYKVELIDISGNPVFTEPFCAKEPSSLGENKFLNLNRFYSKKLVAKTVKSQRYKVSESNDKCYEREFIYIDLDSIPYGKYYVEITDRDNKKVVKTDPPFISHGSALFPLGFVDILLTAPAKANDNFYPIQNGKVVPQSYLISFNMRSTLWKYYVVIPKNRVSFDDLEIQGNGITFNPLPRERVNGNLAWPFESDKPIALKEAPSYKFTLRGQKEGALSWLPIISRLPAASADQVLPETGSKNEAKAKKEAKAEAEAKGKTKTKAKLKAETKTVYSDIYVYV